MQYFTNHNVFIYNICAVSFVCVIVCLCMKFTFSNRFYTFIGSHVFWIYILQRIPMIIFQNKINNYYIYFVVCFVITILLSIVFKRITDIINKKMFLRKKEFL